jgi:hypothetical protein
MRKNVNEIEKVLQTHGYSINTIISDVMKTFKLKSLCHQVGFMKSEGYSTTEIFALMIMFPLMLLKSVHAFYQSQYQNVTEMKKDAIYRLKNNEKMPWRSLLLGIAKQFQNLVNPCKEVAANSAFIIDDTTDARVGKKIENISMVYDHVGSKKGNKPGFKNLTLGLFDGTSFSPLDFSLHMEKKLKAKQRKKQYKKLCDPRMPGAKRRKECSADKITNALKMIKRAVKHGFKAKYVLVDSWFGSKGFIVSVRQIKDKAMHIICGVRKDKRQYIYNDEKLNAKQLLAKLRKEQKEKRCRKRNTRYYEVVVEYEGIGPVRLYFCRFPYQKEWRLFLSTDTSLSFFTMLEIYSVRWTIEVFFKETKQHLKLGRCQSRDFDAQIAHVTTCYILYIFLSYFRRINAYESLGGLFESIKDELMEKNVAQRLWELFDELLQVVIDAISKSGTIDIKEFKHSPEYQYLKELFEGSFLSNQLLALDNAA